MQQHFKFTDDTEDMVFASTLIWFTHTLTNTQNTQTNRLTHKHKYILTPPVVCTQQIAVLHWMNNLLIQKVTLQSVTMPLLFKNYTLVKVIYLLIRFNKTKFFLWNTNSIDRNGKNEQNTHHKERKTTLEKVG